MLFRQFFRLIFLITFQLRYLGGTSGTGGTVIGTKVTGKNGTAIWTGLKSGTY
ncbi:SpaA isopeptide-forming pilin-related protein, partial [uncultured Escherichia sp.]|uniref:SpaA isopeptide-forming pilin-related protein n=1 Tax=uncultured Escherichia sp. TaxID=237777 RepID=UPI003418400B